MHANVLKIISELKHSLMNLETAIQSQDTGKFRTKLLDKFYTNPTIATLCVQQVMTLIGNPGGFVWIEPSAGGGAFINALKGVAPNAAIMAIDIAPDHRDVVAADFMEWQPGVENALFFGNPPFGKQGSLARKFITRAAHLNAKWIAFILPRSFEKPSLQTAFPPLYHNRLSLRLDPNAFLVNNEPHDVPCVFQIWERMNAPRETHRPVEPKGFKYVRNTDTHDIIVRRVGVYAGRAFLFQESGTHSPQSHYFIQIQVPLSNKKQLVEYLCSYEFPSNTTGPRSLSKGEVSEVINNFFDAEQTQ